MKVEDFKINFDGAIKNIETNTSKKSDLLNKQYQLIKYINSAKFLNKTAKLMLLKKINNAVNSRIDRALHYTT